MAAVAVGVGLEERRSLLRTGALDGLGHRIAHGQEVHAVDLAAGDPIGRGPLVEVLHRRGAVDRRAHAVAVVLDDVDDRQVPQRAHVQRLVERSLVDRAVAEEAQADLVGIAEADAVADAGGQRQVAAHDPVAAEVAAGHVVEVHAAALAAADARELPAQLGEQQAGVRSPREGVAVVAVIRDEVVIGPHHAHGPDADRFLADVEVEEAADPALDVELGAPLLEAADEQHLLVQPERFVVIHDSAFFILPEPEHAR